MVEEELGGIIQAFIQDNVVSGHTNRNELDLELLDVVVERRVLLLI